MEHQGLVISFQASDEDGPIGVWIALSLDFDLMAQGDTEEKAIENLKWGIETAIQDDRTRGLDPWSRSPTTLQNLLRLLRDYENDQSMSLQRVTFAL